MTDTGRRWCRGVLYFVLGLVLAQICLMLLITRESMVERLFIFFPTRTLEHTPRQAGLDFQDLFFPTADGLLLHGWYLPAGDAPVVLWCHGNGGNIGYEVENLARLRQSGLGVFIFDYRGYGLSQGRASEAGVYLDALAAYEALRDRGGVSPSRIVIFGRSLGGAVATALAMRVPARALILESTFTNVGDMARHHYFWVPGTRRWTHKFDSLSRVARLTLPKLIVHGDRDRIVPLRMGEQLYEAAAAPKEFYLIRGAGHEDTFVVGGRDYLERLTRFIRQAS